MKFIYENTKILEKNNTIESEQYFKHNVKRGLRNEDGTGVLVGLSKVSSVEGYDIVDGEKKPKEGELYYRGYDISSIIQGFQNDTRHGFEEVIYLLVFGQLPTKKELVGFRELLGEYRAIPKHFLENMILKNPSTSIMNKLQRSILVLFSYEKNPDSIEMEHIIRQSLELIARFPTIIAYGYQAKNHYYNNASLIIHKPVKKYSIAEYILYLIRADKQFTKIEADTLDLCLMLHADHGANNSSFATHVVASSGTDTYSAISAAVGSLKGDKHGGASNYVYQMITNIKENCNYLDDVELKEYLKKILAKEANNETGLIYGMGHAVYTLSDPRAEWLRKKARSLAVEKNSLQEFELYHRVELLTKEIFQERKGIRICANVDLYSGFVYQQLNIPSDLYTPLFAVSRVAGWVAHRIEQLLSEKRIIRPAYRFVGTYKDYVNLKDRK